MESETNPWYEQLADWYKSTKKTFSEIKKVTRIPKTTLGTYLHGKVKNLDRISPERRNMLYNITGLECLKYEGPTIEIGEPKQVGKEPKTGEAKEEYKEKGSLELLKKPKEKIDGLIGKLIEEITSQLTGLQKLEVGVLKVQQHTPSAQERVDGIMELLDVLSEEIDYFRTASKEEQKALIDRLKKEPQSYDYFVKMINIFYKGDNMETWMLMSQPLSKIKRVFKNKIK